MITGLKQLNKIKLSRYVEGKCAMFSVQRECISIHVGQAGAQIGNACWELYSLEHGLQPEVRCPMTRLLEEEMIPSVSFLVRGRKAIFVDLEQTVIGQCYKADDIFHCLNVFIY